MENDEHLTAAVTPFAHISSNQASGTPVCNSTDEVESIEAVVAKAERHKPRQRPDSAMLFDKAITDIYYEVINEDEAAARMLEEEPLRALTHMELKRLKKESYALKACGTPGTETKELAGCCEDFEGPATRAVRSRNHRSSKRSLFERSAALDVCSFY